MKKVLLSFSILLLLTAFAYAQDLKDKVKLSGLMYSDFFYNIDNSDAAKKDLNGFQFRRIYFTADFAIADNFDARFRTDTDGGTNSNTPGGKFGVMVKDAYVKWKGLFSGSDLVLGISPTPAFDVSEAAWGYRSLEKTILDLDGIVSSRDFGVDLKGKLMGDGTVNYWLKVANNSGNGPESDKYKRYYSMLHFKLTDGLQATVYADYASKANKLDSFDKQSKSNNQFVGSFFLGYKQKENFSIGLEAFTRSIQNNFAKSSTSALQNQSSLGFSLWGWASLSEDFRLIGRFDNYDPNQDLDNDGKSFFMAGLDYRPGRNFSVIPNFQYVSYQANDAQGIPKSDLVARVTFTFTF
ncbi:MAG: hypothetical protein CVV24_12085 [Ignavibacteriae bacterium HGW-Ignavibacteriae-3]|nr:MAG: hypothetical protein CVV24_12085 [Ignavibacteriae bacterium HGW-Ignavibacteriae-3]